MFRVGHMYCSLLVLLKCHSFHSRLNASVPIVKYLKVAESKSILFDVYLPQNMMHP